MELHLFTFVFEILPHGFYLTLLSYSFYPFLYLQDIVHCIIVSFLYNFIYFAEIHQSKLVLPVYYNAGLIRNAIIGLGHHHVHNLPYNIFLIHFNLGWNAFRSNYVVGIVIFFHYIPWEIIIKTTIKKEGSVYYNRLKIEGIGHRGPDCGTEVAAFRDKRALSLYIRCYTEIGHHQ